MNQVLAIVRAGVYYSFLKQQEQGDREIPERMSEGVKMRTCAYYSGTTQLKCAINPTEPCLPCTHYERVERG